MSLLGVRLTLLIGPTVAVPAPPPLAEAIDEVEVTHSDRGRSGFQITFRAGRSGLADVFDYPLLTLPLLKTNNRVILVVTWGVVPRVLMDGLITRQQVSPGTRPGSGKITVTGEDVSVAMDLKEVSAEHPAQDETIIANKIIATYAQYGLIPMVIPPMAIDIPIPIERTPVQQGTDLDFLQQMAERNGYVFYVKPGPAPFTNTAYWGPPIRAGLPQRAISVNVGAETNATLGEFKVDARAPETVEGRVQDRLSNQAMPVRTMAPLRPPLAAIPAWLANQPNVRSTQFRESGLSVTQSFGRAQGRTDAASDEAVTVDGELDAGHYGDMLEPRALVGVRGAGWTHDGLWYVKKVTHKIKPGQYKQAFTLAREGTGSTVPAVIP